MKISRQRFSFLSRRRRSTSHLKASQSESRRLRFESLEDRRMLAVFAVSNLDDAGAGSLRAAIDDANNSVNSGGADEIAFVGAATSGVIDLTSGELEITEALTINGPGQGALTIDAQQGSRVLNFSASSGNLTLAGLTITGGRTTGNSQNAADLTLSGGGIRFLSNGELTLASSTVSGNSTIGRFAHGGGIYSSSGEITLTDSTVSENSTAGYGADGGGIHFRGSLVKLTNSTISENLTTGSRADGGGISSRGIVSLNSSTVSGNITAGSFSDGGGIYSNNVIGILFSTITGNHATRGSSFGGGLWSLDDRVFSSHSIVAGNTAGGGSPDIAPGTGDLDIFYSLIGQTGLGIDSGTNIIGHSANLGLLADNGGPTETHALLAGSPAIDKGVSGPTIIIIPSFDQRGAPFARILGGRIDIGSYESQPASAFPAGDYNLNGTVDAADYTVWLDTLGNSVTAFSGADGDGDGVVGQDDYGIWKANFGNTALSATGTETGEAASAADEGGAIEAAEPVAVIQAVEPSSEVVTPLAPLPASLNSELVDLAFPFVLQDRNGYVPRVKQSLANPVQEPTTDVDLLFRYDDLTRPTSTATTLTLETQREEDSRDSTKSRHAWEDAFDKVFAEELIAEELETV